jgi:hypothetical protein
MSPAGRVLVAVERLLNFLPVLLDRQRLAPEHCLGTTAQGP